MKAWVAGALVLNVALGIGLLTYFLFFVPKIVERRIKESVACFSEAIEARFPNHDGLTQRVISLSIAIGRQMGLSRTELFDLEIACRVRDIGLCAVPFKLVNERSKHSWNWDERRQYFSHAAIGAEMLRETRTLKHLAEAVEHHHEDYICSESGEKIPVASRIICLASEYIWLESTRGDLLARESIRSMSGQRFDPIVVQAWTLVLTSSRVWERAVKPVSVA